MDALVSGLDSEGSEKSELLCKFWPQGMTQVQVYQFTMPQPESRGRSAASQSQCRYQYSPQGHISIFDSSFEVLGRLWPGRVCHSVWLSMLRMDHSSVDRCTNIRSSQIAQVWEHSTAVMNCIPDSETAGVRIPKGGFVL